MKGPQAAPCPFGHVRTQQNEPGRASPIRNKCHTGCGTLSRWPQCTKMGDMGRELGEGKARVDKGWFLWEHLGDPVGPSPARRGSRGIYPPSPSASGQGLLRGTPAPLLAAGHVRCSRRAWMGWRFSRVWKGGFVTFRVTAPWGGGSLGLSEPGCASPSPSLQPAVCIFGVPVCVYLPCMCLRLYLSGTGVHVFVFPSALSPLTWGKLLFLIKGQGTVSTPH